ncbi:MAG: helix-turn-helix domain-containing protein [Lachnospiraceae bacterium]|nr:helix-turn-helix domain-containing protein [Lachnospiraceae bacterium]
MNMLFAETLKKLRKERGLSQTQLGKKMFVNNSTVARWENGSRLPDAAMIARLSKALEVDVGTLLEINPRTNIVYLTAYPDYALDAWDTEACGFMVKPLSPERVRTQLKKLRYPIKGVNGV